jgi:hypothetical protein
MDDDAKDRRNWRLATIGVLLIAVLAHLAWVGCSWHWIRERQATLSDLERYFLFDHWDGDRPAAPRMLALLGETGVPCLSPGIAALLDRSPEELSRLFPEAQWLPAAEWSERVGDLASTSDAASTRAGDHASRSANSRRKPFEWIADIPYRQ